MKRGITKLGHVVKKKNRKGGVFCTCWNVVISVFDFIIIARLTKICSHRILSPCTYSKLEKTPDFSQIMQDQCCFGTVRVSVCVYMYYICINICSTVQGTDKNSCSDFPLWLFLFLGPGKHLQTRILASEPRYGLDGPYTHTHARTHSNPQLTDPLLILRTSLC